MAKRKIALIWTIFFVLLIIVIFVSVSYHLREPTVIPSVTPHVERHIAVKPISLTQAKTVRILSLSGGGVRGIIELHVLRYLEKATGKPISKLFDFVTCASTGCLIAARLLTPNLNGGPQFTAAQVLASYDAQARRIFYTPFYHKIFSLNGLIAPKYSNRVKGEVLRKDFGDTVLLSQLLLPTVIVTYSLDRRAPQLFHSRSTEAQDYYLWTVLNAATSAPSFFAPTILQSVDHKFPKEAVIDGGVFAANPSIVALIQAIVHYPHAKYLLVSIGTGYHIPRISDNKALQWGELRWWRDLFQIVFNAITVSSDRALSVLDSSDIIGRDLDYYYFSLEISSMEDSLDDVSPENIKRLNAYGEELVKKNRSQLDRLAKRLSK